MTIIKSKVERSYWKNAALSAVPDVLVAWAAMRLMDGGAEVFFGTLIALQALYLALWMKRSAWSWLLFWFTNRSMMSSHIEEVLAQQRFPRPPDFISGPDEYYSGIVDDESVETSIRPNDKRRIDAAGRDAEIGDEFYPRVTPVHHFGISATRLCRGVYPMDLDAYLANPVPVDGTRGRPCRHKGLRPCWAREGLTLQVVGRNEQYGSGNRGLCGTCA